MIVAIDGAVKAPGTPECLSVGVALFPEATATDALYQCICEGTGSTSQRGEINGLLVALQTVSETITDDSLVVLTDSEYLYNTIMGEWLQKWESASWISASGGPPKNKDLWEQVLKYLRQLEERNVEVVMVWTKGHIYRYPAGQATRCMQADATGATLLSSINTMLQVASQRERAVDNFNNIRLEHNLPALPANIAADYIVYNTAVDAIAVFCANLFKQVRDDKISSNIN